MLKKVTIAEELKRFNQINNYVKNLITEQDIPYLNAEQPKPTETTPPADGAQPVDGLPPAGGEMPADGVPPVDGSQPTNDVPLPTETMVEPTSDDTTEEMDITDLVNMTKSIKQQLDDKQDNGDTTQKMDGIFSKLTELETKLQGMDQLIAKIDNLGVELQNSKPKTPEEKLEMRSLDSFPFNKNPQEFFADKKEEMRASGKNEYVLTKNDVENYGKNEITKSFNPNEVDNNDLRY